jgi:hypothetical protein
MLLVLFTIIQRGAGYLNIPPRSTVGVCNLYKFSTFCDPVERGVRNLYNFLTFCDAIYCHVL